MTMGQNGGSQDTGGQKDLQDRASNVAEEAGRTVEHRASDIMDQASQTLTQLAKAFRQVGDDLRSEQPQLAGLADTAASRVDDASSYLRGHDATDVISAAQEAARRQPALAIGGGLLLGFALARLLRSSEPMSTSGGWGGSGQGGIGGYGSSGYGSSGYGSSGYGGRAGAGYGASGYASGSPAASSTYGTSYGGSYGETGGVYGDTAPIGATAGDYAGSATPGGYGTSDTLAGDPDALVDEPTVVSEIDVIEADGGPTSEG